MDIEPQLESLLDANDSLFSGDGVMAFLILALTDTWLI